MTERIKGQMTVAEEIAIVTLADAIHKLRRLRVEASRAEHALDEAEREMKNIVAKAYAEITNPKG